VDLRKEAGKGAAGFLVRLRGKNGREGGGEKAKWKAFLHKY